MRRNFGSEERDDGAASDVGGHVSAALPLHQSAAQQAALGAWALKPVDEGKQAAASTATAAATAPAGAAYAVVDKENVGVAPHQLSISRPLTGTYFYLLTYLHQLSRQA